MNFELKKIAYIELDTHAEIYVGMKFVRNFITDMKKFYFLLILNTFFSNGQIVRDTIFGKPKFVKEYVLFLNNSGPFTFMKGDDEYGHAMIKTPQNLRNSMNVTWFETNFCRYINNETYYDVNRNLVREKWFYKSGEILDDYTYEYDNLGRKIEENSQNKFSKRFVKFFYKGSSKEASFKEIKYKWENEPIERHVYNYENKRPLLVSKYDTLTKSDSIFVLTNQIWKKVGDRSYTQITDTIYHKKLFEIKIYDDKYNVIEEKKFKYDSDYENRKIYQSSHLFYKYNEYGQVIEKIDYKDGEIHYYEVSKGKFIPEDKIDGFINVNKTNFVYNSKRLLIEKSMLSNDKLWFQTKFEYDNNYIKRLYYFEKYGKEDKNIQPDIILFKYKLDKNSNWIEITKNVNGKDLYIWKREIKYF